MSNTIKIKRLNLWKNKVIRNKEIIKQNNLTYNLIKILFQFISI